MCGRVIMMCWSGGYDVLVRNGQETHDLASDASLPPVGQTQTQLRERPDLASQPALFFLGNVPLDQTVFAHGAGLGARLWFWLRGLGALTACANALEL